MRKIKDKEIKFHEHSFFDPAGRLFWLEEKLYRNINPKWISFYKNLFDTGIIEKLVAQELLIESTIAPLSLDDGSIVIEHRVIPFLSYPYEWCPAMFKSAAVTTIDLLLALSEKSLTLKDGHPGNILFDFYQPIYIDLPSIAAIEHYLLWPGYAYEDFCETCLYPLILMNSGQYSLAKLFLAGDARLSLKDLLRFTQGRIIGSILCFYMRALKAKLNYKYYTYMFNESSRKIPKSNYSEGFLEHLKTSIKNMNSPVFQDKGVRKPLPCLLNQSNWTTKQENIFLIIQEKSPHSVLDIENIDDWYAKASALAGSRVISFSIDVQYANQLYKDAQYHQLKILSLIMSFMKPTPSWGPSNHWAISAYERFRSDLVLALSIIHYWVKDLYFEQIVEGLFLLSGKCLIIEFVSLEDPEFKDKSWLSKVKAWYSLEKLMDVLKTRFLRVKLIASDSEYRTLLVCEK